MWHKGFMALQEEGVLAPSKLVGDGPSNERRAPEKGKSTDSSVAVQGRGKCLDREGQNMGKGKQMKVSSHP